MAKATKNKNKAAVQGIFWCGCTRPSAKITLQWRQIKMKWAQLTHQSNKSRPTSQATLMQLRQPTLLSQVCLSKRQTSTCMIPWWCPHSKCARVSGAAPPPYSVFFFLCFKFSQERSTTCWTWKQSQSHWEEKRHQDSLSSYHSLWSCET